MSAQFEWATDIFNAADELGYGVESLTPGSITLSDDRTTLTISGVFLSGRLLRDRLKSGKPDTLAVWPGADGETRTEA